MADKNLTGAIFELKDRKQSALPPKRKTPPKASSQALPYRSRAFDMFFAFASILLVLSLVSQLAAMFAFL